MVFMDDSLRQSPSERDLRFFSELSPEEQRGFLNLMRNEREWKALQRNRALIQWTLVVVLSWGFLSVIFTFVSAGAQDVGKFVFLTAGFLVCAAFTFRALGPLFDPLDARGDLPPGKYNE